MKPSPRSPELFKDASAGNPKNGTASQKPAHPLLGISRERTYKGGRVLPYAIRFRFWRETQGFSLAKIAARLEDKTRDYHIDGQYLLTRLMELEQGRHKAPAWLMFLLVETYGIRFPWNEFWDGESK